MKLDNIFKTNRIIRSIADEYFQITELFDQ